MKNKIIGVFAFFAMLFLACEPYEDYSFETFEFTDVYFPKEVLGRTTVAGEGLEIKVGVYLGGMRNNTKEQTVKFKIDPSLLDGTPYTLLPEEYYTLSNENTIIVPEGILQGFVTVNFDSLKFAADTKTLEQLYAIPFVITESSLDSILEPKKSTIIPIKYINTFEGDYYQVGSLKKFTSETSDTLESVLGYGDLLDFVSSPIRKLKTVNMDTVVVEGIADQTSGAFRMNLAVDYATNKVSIVAVEGSKYLVENDGASTWDPVTRRFSLSYKFTFKGNLYKVHEKLVFRNRVRDNINEWRWPGFDGNL